MTRRLPKTERPQSEKTAADADNDLAIEKLRIEGLFDPDADPTENFPQWSRSLLLLLDYATIEGLQHGLHSFVHYLKLAEAELTKVASDEAQSGQTSKPDAESNSVRVPPAKVH